MKDIKIDMTNNTVTITRRFAEKASDPRTDEYRLLQQVRDNYPNFIVKRHSIRKNPKKECYRGLTYDYMRYYISTHEDENREKVLAEFDEMILISQCHSKGFRYPTIKSWFLEKYEAVANFGTELEKFNEEIKQKTKALKRLRVCSSVG